MEKTNYQLKFEDMVGELGTTLSVDNHPKTKQAVNQLITLIWAKRLEDGALDDWECWLGDIMFEEVLNPSTERE